MGFAGAGGPPPSKSKGGVNARDSFKFKEQVMTPDGPANRSLSSWFVDQGESKPCTMLDRFDDDETPERKKFAVNVHSFRFGGRWGSMVTAIDDPRGDPVAEALKEVSAGWKFPYKGAKWFWVLTCLDESTWSPDNSDKVYTLRRRPVFVTANNVDGMELVQNRGGPGEEDPDDRLEGWDGFRLRRFRVERSGDKSFSIGTAWLPKANNPIWDEQKLLDKIAEIAEDYGMTPEEYIEPFDYAKVFAPRSYEEQQKVAELILADAKGGLSAKEAAQAASDTMGSVDENNIPF